MKLPNKSSKKLSNIGQRLKIAIYIVGVISLSLGIIDRFSNIFLGHGINVSGVLAVIALTLLIIYWNWFKPERKHKDFIKKADKYIYNFKDNDKAVEVLKQSLDLDGITNLEKADTLVRIGRLYMEDEDIINGDRYFNEALKVDINELIKGDLLSQMAHSYFEAGRYSKASKIFDDIFEIGLRHLDKIYISKPTLITVIKSYVYDGKRQRAEQLYNLLLRERVIKENAKVERLFDERE